MSDESAAGPQPTETKTPEKPKRILRPLTEDQWARARIQFETSAAEVTLTRIAAVFNTSLSSVQKRSAAEQWSKGAELVADARKQLKSQMDGALATAAEKTASEVTKRLMTELQPWIEKEKRAHIQRAIKRSKRGMKRLDRVAKGFSVYDSKLGTTVELEPGPKDEMHIAQAEDKYDNIIRRNLGMSDSSGFSGALNVQVLAGQAQVNVTQN